MAVRNGGAFASTAVGTYSRIMLSVLEDPVLAELSTTGDLTLDQLRLMATASARGTGFDPDSRRTPDAATIAALLADHVSMAVLNHRPAAIRLVPVPGKKAGDRVEYDNTQLGQAAVFGVPGPAWRASSSPAAAACRRYVSNAAQKRFRRERRRGCRLWQLSLSTGGPDRLECRGRSRKQFVGMSLPHVVG